MLGSCGDLQWGSGTKASQRVAFTEVRPSTNARVTLAGGQVSRTFCIPEIVRIAYCFTLLSYRGRIPVVLAASKALGLKSGSCGRRQRIPEAQHGSEPGQVSLWR